MDEFRIYAALELPKYRSRVLRVFGNSCFLCSCIWNILLIDHLYIVLFLVSIQALAQSIYIF